MTTSDVHEVLAALDRTGVPVWVAGGWGVDALLGEQTRRHGDLDLLIDEASDGRRRAVAALAAVGYFPSDAQGTPGALLPVRTILRNPSGRIVELLFFRRPGAPVVTAAPELTDDALASGWLGGCVVGCLSAAEQLRLHSSYAPAPHDRIDVQRICQRFDLAFPPEYRSR
jgi:lincosamide nucleotidyltransferase A/C/D/E